MENNQNNNNETNPAAKPSKKAWQTPNFYLLDSAEDINAGANPGAHEKNYVSSHKSSFTTFTSHRHYTSYRFHKGVGPAATYVGKDHPLNFYYS